MCRSVYAELCLRALTMLVDAHLHDAKVLSDVGKKRNFQDGGAVNLGI